MLPENNLTGVVMNSGDCEEPDQLTCTEIAIYKPSNSGTGSNEGDRQTIITEENENTCQDEVAPENIYLTNLEMGNPLELPGLQSSVQKASKDQSILDVPPPTPPFELVTVGAATESGGGIERKQMPGDLEKGLDFSSGRSEVVPELTGSEETSLRIDSSTNSLGPHQGTATSGIRMVRVSLLWLFVSGSILLALIFVLNTITKPADQFGEVSKDLQSTNSSTNQSPARPIEAATLPRQEPEVDPTPAPTVEPTPELATQPEQVAKPEITKPAAVQTTKASDGKFTIQIGSYNESGQAMERLASLNSLGIDARIAQVEIPKRGTWYRVQIGRFSTRDEANRYAGELRATRVAENTIVTEISD